MALLGCNFFISSDMIENIPAPELDKIMRGTIGDKLGEFLAKNLEEEDFDVKSESTSRHPMERGEGNWRRTKTVDLRLRVFTMRENAKLKEALGNLKHLLHGYQLDAYDKVINILNKPHLNDNPVVE